MTNEPYLQERIQEIKFGPEIIPYPVQSHEPGPGGSPAVGWGPRHAPRCHLPKGKMFRWLITGGLLSQQNKYPSM
jgi:hypothetical protein